MMPDVFNDALLKGSMTACRPPGPSQRIYSHCPRKLVFCAPSRRRSGAFSLYHSDASLVTFGACSGTLRRTRSAPLAWRY